MKPFMSLLCSLIVVVVQIELSYSNQNNPISCLSPGTVVCDLNLNDAKGKIHSIESVELNGKLLPQKQRTLRNPSIKTIFNEPSQDAIITIRGRYLLEPPKPLDIQFHCKCSREESTWNGYIPGNLARVSSFEHTFMYEVPKSNYGSLLCEEPIDKIRFSRMLSTEEEMSSTCGVNMTLNIPRTIAIPTMNLAEAYCGHATRMVRYTFVAAVAGEYFFDTSGSECEDTILIISGPAGCYDNPQAQARKKCNDDFFEENHWAASAEDLQAGESVAVFIGGYGDDCNGQNVTLSVTFVRAMVTAMPTTAPTVTPTVIIGDPETFAPSLSPSLLQLGLQTFAPTSSPSQSPSLKTRQPSTNVPSRTPTLLATPSPSLSPNARSTLQNTSAPASLSPTLEKTKTPSKATRIPSSKRPTKTPSNKPSPKPTTQKIRTLKPTTKTKRTKNPTNVPTIAQAPKLPTSAPSVSPSITESHHTRAPLSASSTIAPTKSQGFTDSPTLISPNEYEIRETESPSTKNGSPFPTLSPSKSPLVTENSLPGAVFLDINSSRTIKLSTMKLGTPLCDVATNVVIFQFKAPISGSFFFDTSYSQCKDTVLMVEGCSSNHTGEACKRCNDDYFDDNRWAANIVELENANIVTIFVGAYKDSCADRNVTLLVTVIHAKETKSPTTLTSSTRSPSTHPTTSINETNIGSLTTAPSGSPTPMAPVTSSPTNANPKTNSPSTIPIKNDLSPTSSPTWITFPPTQSPSTNSPTTTNLPPCGIILNEKSVRTITLSTVTLSGLFCGVATKVIQFQFKALTSGRYFFDTSYSECQDTVLMIAGPAGCYTNPRDQPRRQCNDDYYDTSRWAAIAANMETDETISIFVGGYEDGCEGRNVTLSVTML